MSEFKFDISDAVKKAQREAQSSLEISIKSRASSIVSSLLDSGAWSKREGMAHEVIRKKIEEYVLSDDFSAQVDRVIGEVMEEETARALRALLNSKIRKHLFTATYPTQEEERANDPAARWVIRLEADPSMSWNGKVWSRNSATLYTWEEKCEAQIPIGGVWELLPGQYARTLEDIFQGGNRHS